ncbi:MULTISPECIES: NADPH-dependent FMN reductase [Gemella]|uniref:NADPH-dependent FMN reductase n=1 Tax=Gemella TaxID=1378 RepID=UPI000AF64CF9
MVQEIKNSKKNNKEVSNKTTVEKNNITKGKGHKKMVKLIGIVGTNSKKSTNRQLLQYIQKHFANKAEIELVEIKDIPLFNKPADKVLPVQVTEIAAKIEAADGVIISSPEYDHAVPASLMSLIAWLSYGIHPLLDKPVMLTGASYGTLGSSRAQAHIRQILDSPEVKARVMPSSEFLLGHSLQAFDEVGDISNPETVQKLDSLFADFLLFIKITEKLMNAHKQAAKEIENFSWEELK